MKRNRHGVALLDISTTELASAATGNESAIPHDSGTGIAVGVDGDEDSMLFQVHKKTAPRTQSISLTARALLVSFSFETSARKLAANLDINTAILDYQVP